LEKSSNELPGSWLSVKIGNLTDLTSGKAFKKSEYTKKGVRLFQIANVSFSKIIWDSLAYLPENYLEKYPRLKLKKGDVLLALNRPILNGKIKVGKLGIDDVPSILYQRVGKFEFFEEKTRDYFYYFLQSSHFLKQLESSLQGVDQPFINKSKLLKFSFQLAPLKEQKRIVSKIEEFFSIIASVEKILDFNNVKCLEFQKSILDFIFSNLTKKSKEKKLFDKFDVRHGDFLPKNKMCEGDIPVFGGNGIVGYHDKNNFEGDILIIGRVGAQCGNIHYYSGKLWFTDNTMGLISKEKLNPKFFLYQLKKFGLNKISAGTGQPYISGKNLLDLKIIVPDISIQDKTVENIEEFFSIIENIIKNIQNLKDLINNFKNKVLEHAFEGKLVPQDPNDEPASELLKRIKASK